MQALAFLEVMQSSEGHIRPDTVTYNTVLKACCNAARLGHAMQASQQLCIITSATAAACAVTCIVICMAPACDKCALVTSVMNDILPYELHCLASNLSGSVADLLALPKQKQILDYQAVSTI